MAFLGRAAKNVPLDFEPVPPPTQPQLARLHAPIRSGTVPLPDGYKADGFPNGTLACEKLRYDSLDGFHQHFRAAGMPS